MSRNVHRTPSPVVRGPLLLFIGAILIGSPPAYGQNGAHGLAYPAKGIVVDGDLGDWPEEARTYPIARVEYGDEPDGGDDLDARFRLAYDPEEGALYVAVEVRDDSVVPDPPGSVAWDAQDGCELYIDAPHASGGAAVSQYCRYGGRDELHGPADGLEHEVDLAVARAGPRTVYEWRIAGDAGLGPDRVIGFDVSVADRDEDGSFSWAAWGAGTQKLDTPGRCGEFLLTTPETGLGEVSGRVEWEEPRPVPLVSRVRIQSVRSAPLWRTAIVDPAGSYEVEGLPVGPYSVHPVDSAELRVDPDPGVEVRVVADRPATADVLRIVPVPWPGLIGAEGVLLGPEPVNPEALERLVRAYLDYYKVPGVSLAVIKDSEIVYHNGMGVKDASTLEPVADDTVFEAASMTKPILAYLVLRLADRGAIGLDTPLYTYLPYDDIAHDDRYKLITARMVLTHRTGFPNWRTGELVLNFEPGTQYMYSGEGFVYLGKVVEHLTGKGLVDLCREEVFSPLGIENASLVWDEDVARVSATGHNGTSPLPKDTPREPNMAYSLHIDARNYARFLIALVAGEGLSEAAHAELLRAQTEVPEEPGGWFGLGVRIEETPSGTSYGHGGRNVGFTSRSCFYKDQGIGYVFLVNNDEALKIDNVLGAYLIAGKSGLKGPEPDAREGRPD
ncbi:serine hydrolase [Tautonia plasticadhaerens]|uniref:D-alanyl-D-alanine carboxypeptidase n=1 Tax=Tautonia plasticadhaerens TaxID=2527974 RepID=A0A518HE23_9BACT|nr:serine hydrolase [Tautonia plasticadhaerens]QDV39091.1 D-alanyl-D-alanine carboxypeptidase precursor [Tautonia plasticadhaerens]